MDATVLALVLAIVRSLVPNGRTAREIVRSAVALTLDQRGHSAQDTTSLLQAITGDPPPRDAEPRPEPAVGDLDAAA